MAKSTAERTLDYCVKIKQCCRFAKIDPSASIYQEKDFQS